MKKNVAKIIRASLPDRGRLVEEIGIDGFSIYEINYIANKFKVHIIPEKKPGINPTEVSTKKYKFEMLVKALTI